MRRLAQRLAALAVLAVCVGVFDASARSAAAANAPRWVRSAGAYEVAVAPNAVERSLTDMVRLRASTLAP